MQNNIVWYDATRLLVYEADNGVILLVVVLSPPLKQVSSKKDHGELRRLTIVQLSLSSSQETARPILIE